MRKSLSLEATFEEEVIKLRTGFKKHLRLAANVGAFKHHLIDLALAEGNNIDRMTYCLGFYFANYLIQTDLYFHRASSEITSNIFLNFSD